MYLLRKILLISLVLVLFSCEKEDFLSNDIDQTARQNEITAKNVAGKTFQGENVPVGSGFVFSWVTFNNYGTLMEVGIDITPEVYESLPRSGDFEKPLIIPFSEDVKKFIPFNHVGLNWSNGNPENPLLTKPHFDVHFFMITVEQRMEIPEFSDESEALFTNYPSAEHFPSGYKPFAKNSRAEAMIGNHWYPTKALKTSDYALFLGSYDGKFTFLDPMVSLDFLKNESLLISEEIPQPAIYPSDKDFPKYFNIYTNKKKNNSITLSTFIQR